MIIYILNNYDEDILMEEPVDEAIASLSKMGHVCIFPYNTPINSYDQLEEAISVCDCVLVFCEDARLINFANKNSIPVYNSIESIEIPKALARSPKQFRTMRMFFNSVYRLTVKKNSDYGPGNIGLTGEIGVLVRLSDKIMRLLNLFGFKFTSTFDEFTNPKDPDFESVNDTWMDVAGYAGIGFTVNKGFWGI